jgi:hypothetical protein
VTGVQTCALPISSNFPTPPIATTSNPNLEWTFTTPSPATGFPVTLTIWDNQTPSCSAINTIPVYVHELPTVDFTAPEVCEGFPTTLTAISTALPPFAVLWDITPATTGSYAGSSDNDDK